MFSNWDEILIQERLNDLKETFNNSEYIILNVFQFIKIIFSDLFYIILTFIIDLKLIFFVRLQMIKKSRLIIRPAFNNVTGLIDLQIQSVENTPAEIQQIRINLLKKRLTKTIILNGINFLVLRLPLALISFYGLFYYRSDPNKYQPNLNAYLICRYYRFCLSLEDFFFLFYLNSFIIKFIIFYRLDKNFK
jgi:hypothetical protein